MRGSRGLYNDRGRLRLLLATSSVAALSIGAPAVWAAPACNNVVTPPFTNAASITNICVHNGNFTGDVLNTGTVSGNGIAIQNATISGGIQSTGIVVGGLSIDRQSSVLSNSVTAIKIGGPTFTGGISNAGTITATGSNNAILVGGVASGIGASVAISTFAGGISNSGTIVANSGNGIVVGGAAFASGASVNVAIFTGGISNSGTVAADSTGIFVGGTAGEGGAVNAANFSGGITNAGKIIGGTANGIIVGGLASGGAVTISSFSGDIVNIGTVIAGHGIVVGGLAVSTSKAGAVTISTFSGDIVNAGLITAATGHGIFVGGAAEFSGASVTILTFAGSISNSGTISAQSVGIFVGGTVAGSGASVAISRFSGGIANSGTISATAGGYIGGFGIGIWVGGFAYSGGSVTVSNFSAGISNSGTITARDAGILVGGDAASRGSVTISTFTGGISNSGTIKAYGVGIFVGGAATSFSSVTISTFSGGVTNSGTISVRSGAGIIIEDVSTFLGNVWNSGRITARSTGIFVCNCATFAGGSIVNTGTITAAEGIVVHNLSPVSIFDSGTITGSAAAIDLTQASGGNTLTLAPGFIIQGNVIANTDGLDTLQLGGIGTYQFDLSSVGPAAQYENFASFNVVSGVWTVFNLFGQTQPWNVLGGTLAGTGTLSAMIVDNGGTLEPGNIGQPGTFMTVTGDLTFQPGAQYLVNISPTTASRVNVGGSVILDGLVEGVLTPGSYSGKTTYDILDPASISGSFAGFTAVNEPGFGGTLTTNGNTDVLLNLMAQLGAGGGLNANQQNAASAINTYFNDGGSLPASFFPVFGLSGGNLATSLSHLDGEAATGAKTAAFQSMDEFLNLLLDPTSVGGSGGGGPLGFAPEQASLPPDVALAYASILKAPPPALVDDHWSVWGAAYGVSNHTDGNPAIGSSNVAASDYGFAAGMEYHLDPSTMYGFAFSGGGTNWNLAQAQGDGRSDTFQAGIYGKRYFGPAYVAGVLAFGNNLFTTNRTAFAGDQLTASFDGQSYAARLEGGYRYGLPAPASGAILGLTPYVALQTQWFHTPAYAETDLTGGGFGLSYNATTANDTRSELGARFDDLTAINTMPVILRGRLAWAHDWVSNPALSASFESLPGSSFTVNGAPIPHDSALTSAGAQLFFTPSWSFTAKFDGEFAPGSQTYAGSGTLRYTW